MKINILKSAIVMVAALSTTLTSCVNDLNVDPIDPNQSTSDKVYTDLYSYEQGLAKVYAGLAVSGQQGPAGNPDLGGLDEGASQYLRKYWEFQELPTDEAINGWVDPGQPALSRVDWTSSNPLVKILYDRMNYQVTLANQFIRDTKRADFNTESDITRLAQIKAEARFLRALSYWHELDFYGNGVPFTDENSPIGSEPPTPYDFEGREIYDFIEKELLEITGESSQADVKQVLKEVGTGMVGQADKGAAYMLLAKLYMNAEVYINESKWTEAQTVLEKVVNGGYALEAVYANNFNADNFLSNEIIFSVNFDGLRTQTYGGTTFLIHGAVGGDYMSAKEYGIDGGWGGHRSTVALVEKFEEGIDNIVDYRGMFFMDNHQRENDDLADFMSGYAVVKFTNRTRLGGYGSDPNLTFVDTNFPMFRLADAYLMLAEIQYRLGGSVTDFTLLEELWNRSEIRPELQQRYKADAQSDPAKFILDERARELYWEGHRRTDLVRFGKFASGYNWPHKGGAVDGSDVDAKYNVLPLPYAELNANPKLKQNPLW